MIIAEWEEGSSPGDSCAQFRVQDLSESTRLGSDALTQRIVDRVFREGDEGIRASRME
jgi:hypothetical protein